MKVWSAERFSWKRMIMPSLNSASKIKKAEFLFSALKKENKGRDRKEGTKALRILHCFCRGLRQSLHIKQPEKACQQSRSLLTCPSVRFTIQWKVPECSHPHRQLCLKPDHCLPMPVPKHEHWFCLSDTAKHQRIIYKQMVLVYISWGLVGSITDSAYFEIHSTTTV